MKILSDLLILTFLFCTVTLPAQAGGLIGDIVEGACGGCGAGRALDRAHSDIKEALPPYKALEEGGTQIVNEAAVQAGATILQELIAQSRDDALANGVEPIPLEIRNNVSGFIPDNILEIVRFRVGGGGDLTLQVNSIRYGDAQAITLDYVVVFKSQQDALYNPALWVHELTHVIQYQNWGLGDFAKRYLRSHHAVEAEAYDNGNRYIAWAATRSSASGGGGADFGKPLSELASGVSSNICSTWMGACQVGGSAPVGTACWCNSPAGGITGSLIPADGGFQTTSIEQGLPSGFAMQQCGCWGANPTQFAQEQRCMSKSVRIAVCPFKCAPFQPAYGYVCN